MQRNTQRLKLAAVAWLLFISTLFFLPGSALPTESWLDAVYADKWIHFGFFFILSFLWRFYWPAGRKQNGWLLLLSTGYGLGVEVVQHTLIANRSFDKWDLVADVAGAAAGIWFWNRYKKNRPL